MSFEMRWLGTACFELILHSGAHLLMDPFMDDSNNSPIKAAEIEACDYLFVTHGHWDHVLDIGYLAERFKPPIYCNQDTARTIVRHQGVDPGLIKVLTFGDRVELDEFQVEVLEGVHTNPRTEYTRITGKEFPRPLTGDDPLQRAKALLLETAGTDQISARHLEWRSMYPGGEQLNFVFELADGQRVYMAGSYPSPQVMREAEKARADITLMQCMSSNKLHGIEGQTCRVITASGCKTAIPQHHDPIYAGGWQTELGLLKQMVEESGICFLEMIPGDWHRFEDGKQV